MIDTVQKVSAPRHRGLAREELGLLVGGAPQTLTIVRQERRLGGSQAYWCCPRCSALRSDLYVVENELACRVCHRLDYRSRHVPRAVARAAKLRRKLGAAPGLLSGLPRRPPHWRADYWVRAIAELVAAERVLGEMLRGTVQAVKRRKDRPDG